jgi:hypothetical protein
LVLVSLIEESVAVMLAARTDEARRHRQAPDHRTRWRVPQLVSRPILVDLPHPTAGPSEPGKNGNPNSPCNKSGFLIVQEDPLHRIYWEKCGAAEL